MTPENNTASGRTHSLNCDNRKKVQITGIKEVISANETVVFVDTTVGMLQLSGAELKIQKFNADEGTLVVSGEFVAFKYDGSPKGGGLFKKLFK